MRKTFITKMPDKAGAFLTASQIIGSRNVNITRVSYNKAIDMHTLFIDVEGEESAIAEISDELYALGYLSSENESAQILLVEFRIPDVPLGVTPILEVINQFHVNISYISSQGTGEPYQAFKMGLLVTQPDDIKAFLDAISKICDIRILDYDKSEKNLDNTVFYLSFANEIASKLCLNAEEKSELILHSNYMMQNLDERNEFPYKTFEYIGKYADYLIRSRGDAYKPRTSKTYLSHGMAIHTIEPPCGSNTYVIEADDRLYFIDSGYAIYEKELEALLRELFPKWDELPKTLLLTHSDMDHCGVQSFFEKIYCTENSKMNFVWENNGEDNIREHNVYHKPYCKISALLSGYHAPNLEKIESLGDRGDSDKPFVKIRDFSIGEMQLEVFEGNGGHVAGEIILLCRDFHLVFTGDILVNANGYTPEQAAFNALAPYLMTSVNMNSPKATEERKALLDMLGKEKYLVLPGHGEPYATK
ncbi:MAG TPA: hypothetical protein PKV44_03250 [Bacillota bacterium]|nr:hypothetical protein [Bacillota bacterium]HPE38283.1 hypothetical protein [Bacillota bacterium]